MLSPTLHWITDGAATSTDERRCVWRVSHPYLIFYTIIYCHSTEVCIGFECVLSTFPSACNSNLGKWIFIGLFVRSPMAWNMSKHRHTDNRNTDSPSRFVPANFISAPSPAHGAFGSKLNIYIKWIYIVRFAELFDARAARAICLLP